MNTPVSLIDVPFLAPGFAAKHTRKSGTTAAQVLWRDADTCKQRFFTYDDPREAEIAKRLIEAAGGRVASAAKLAAEIRSAKPSLGEVVAEHISLLTGAGPDTVMRYKRQLKQHIMPTLGGLGIDKLTLRHVAGWVQGLQRSGLSPKTVANLHGLLSAAMNTAVRLGYRDDNPCDATRLPQAAPGSQKAMFLTREEFQLIVDAFDERYRPLVWLLVASGLRWGEVTALTVADIDLRSTPAMVTVSKAWKRDGDGARYVGPPKSRRSNRAVSLPPEVVPMLRPLTVGRRRDELLFVNGIGEAIKDNTFKQEYWYPALRRAADPVDVHGEPDDGAPRLTKKPRVHDLRHTHASWMIEAGVDLFTLQRRLGHESITTTTETYGHLMPEQQRSAAEAASRAIRPKSKDSKKNR